MIISGYQGIGKSTLAARNWTYIDLESSSFWYECPETKQMVRHSNWYDIYCNVAEHLSKQGYRVFVSSHQLVRDRLKKSSENVCVCAPSLELKDQWLDRLYTRFMESQLEKDYKAFANALDRYDENIKEIRDCGLPVIEIKKIPYDLDLLINREVARRIEQW